MLLTEIKVLKDGESNNNYRFLYVSQSRFKTALIPTKHATPIGANERRYLKPCGRAYI